MMGTASQWEKTTKKHRQRLFADNQKHSHSLFAEERISQAKGATKSLKRHTDNGTCPETLKYRTKAKIRADNGFKRTSSASIKKRGTRNPQSDNTFPSPWKQPLQGTGQESKESQAGSHSTAIAPENCTSIKPAHTVLAEKSRDRERNSGKSPGSNHPVWHNDGKIKSHWE